MANNTGNKFGGRQKGTPNKLTKDLRNLLKDIVCTELESIDQRFVQLDPKERIELLIKLMPYVFPKLKSVSHSQDEPLDWWMD